MSRLEHPVEMIFVRHGESIANIIQGADKKGDPSGFTPEFRSMHNSKVPLTEKGIKQARLAGRWLVGNVNGGIYDQNYVSSYRRTRETARYLELPAGTGKIWKVRDNLREQEWGQLDHLPEEERKALYPEAMLARERDGMFWRGIGGESRIDIADRARNGIIRSMYDDLAEGGIGLAVTHGNLIWGVRMVLEAWTHVDLGQIDNRHNNPLEKMSNCQIIHYTNRNPEDPSDIRPKLSWVRSVCPWNLSLSSNEWRVIVRPKYTNVELLDDRWEIN